MSHAKQPILPPFSGIGQTPRESMKAAYAEFLEAMIRIREFEENVQRLYVKGVIHGTTHLCQGQEAIAVGAARALRPQDYVTVTYRSHGHAIAKGMEPRGIFAELMGRASGCSKGKGGSMHLTDFDRQVIGSFGIVGAGLPVALGAAVSARLQGEDRVSATFFGDGAANIGAFHETLNMAAVWRAPVVFICENNIYGEFSRIDETTAVIRLADRAAAYGMPSARVDGNNVLEVFEAVKQAVDRAVKGDGPTLLECVTYRHRGHSRTDPAKYRPAEEVQAWLAYDPIRLYREWLRQHGLIADAQAETMQERIRAELVRDAEAAEAAPRPDPGELLTDVYAD